jgi:hypothetical protein
MITEAELRGELRPKLRGVSRRVGHLIDPAKEAERVKNRRRNQRWRKANPGKHRAYQRQYAKENRAICNARVDRFKERHPERRAAQLRAAARRYQRKKRGLPT